MIGIRNPFYRKTKTEIWLVCDHCAKQFWVYLENVRVVNYCGACK